jgi:transcriptional regulator with XRE-family HTH domain
MAERAPALVALGEAVRVRRGESGMSQEALGYAAGLHRNYIGGVERGERNVSYLNLRKLAAALSITSSELVALAEANESAG